MSRFSKYQGSFAPHYVYLINEQELEILGGGDWYSWYDRGETPEPIAEETRAQAEAIATEFGMRITDSYGRWEGYSEYTPDPGDISHFDWEPINV